MRKLTHVSDQSGVRACTWVHVSVYSPTCALLEVRGHGWAPSLVVFSFLFESGSRTEPAVG